jgi:hypothetical protein
LRSRHRGAKPIMIEVLKIKRAGAGPALVKGQM